MLRCLRELAARSARPLVVLFDEADGLVGEAMVSFLTQLRQGYLDRSRTPFPASVVLIGQRQATSQFNITAEATTLDAFTEAETAELLGQHTAAAGQRFGPETARRIWELAQGHPWLTSALAQGPPRTGVRQQANLTPFIAVSSFPSPSLASTRTDTPQIAEPAGQVL